MPSATTVPAATAEAIARTRAAGGRIVAVGTTSLRTLEAAAAKDGTVRAGSDETRLFITPGYRFRAVDRLITNFHLPKLDADDAGQRLRRHADRSATAYAHAIAQRYRFFSYGDAMLLSRDAGRAPIAGRP